jgi:hypothetical protein
MRELQADDDKHEQAWIQLSVAGMLSFHVASQEFYFRSLLVDSA